MDLSPVYYPWSFYIKILSKKSNFATKKYRKILEKISKKCRKKSRVNKGKLGLIRAF
jgi:hypothetical protein